MNAIPLINNAPRPNINVGSIGSPAFNPVAAGAKLGGSIGGNVMRQNPASMPVNNETQLRQEVNTSIVALKREAFSLENLIAQAAQTLQDINKRLSELEGKQGDYVKKADATVESVGGDGKYISAISETDGKINATATDLGNMVPVDTVTSGNMHSVTSNAVAERLDNYVCTDSLMPLSKIDLTQFHAVAYIPQNIVLELKNMAGKHLDIEFGVYEYQNDFFVQVSWGFLSAVVQYSTGIGRTNYLSITNQDTPYVIMTGMKIYRVSIDIPADCDFVGIASNFNIFFYNLNIS